MTIGLWALFLSGFLAATLLPGGSEPLLVAYLLASPTAGWWPTALTAIVVVGVANTAGGAVTYAMGRGVRLVWRKWQKPENPDGAAQRRARRWLERWGPWALLWSWVPVVGDPLCLFAGTMRLAAGKCILAMALGKFARYVVIAAAVLQV